MRVGALLIGALAMVATGVAAQAAAGDGDIVVVARRLEQATLTLGRDGDGRTTCGLGRSSGDVRLDGAICRRAARCIGREAVAQARVDACIARQKQRLAADWVRGARS